MVADHITCHAGWGEIKNFTSVIAENQHFSTQEMKFMSFKGEMNAEFSDVDCKVF